MGFTSLAYHIDLRWLYEAYLRVRPDGAAGVDGQTIEDLYRTGNQVEMEDALANWLRVQIARIEKERGASRKEGAA